MVSLSDIEPATLESLLNRLAACADEEQSKPLTPDILGCLLPLFAWALELFIRVGPSSLSLSAPVSCCFLRHPRLLPFLILQLRNAQQPPQLVVSIMRLASLSLIPRVNSEPGYEPFQGLVQVSMRVLLPFSDNQTIQTTQYVHKCSFLSGCVCSRID